MCGRFLNRAPASETARIFGTKNPLLNWPAHYNIAPTQDVLAVRFNCETRERSLDVLRWGLIPFWAKDAKLGYSLINARAEGIDTKPSFRDAFKSRRCIIPADGFYEWKKLDAKTKQPYAIVPTGDEPFAFAGLWERWKDPTSGEIVRSCSIVTGEPNELVAPIHNRMPVILDRATWPMWLGETAGERGGLLELLKPCPADRMRTYAIGPRVGNVKNDDPSLIEAVGDVRR
jgi:putative SOS response-associated peptidase YedK